MRMIDNMVLLYYDKFIKCPQGMRTGKELKSMIVREVESF